MTDKFHVMLNIPEKSLSNFANNALILHAIDNGIHLSIAQTRHSPLEYSKQQCTIISYPEDFRLQRHWSGGLLSLSFYLLFHNTQNIAMISQTTLACGRSIFASSIWLIRLSCVAVCPYWYKTYLCRVYVWVITKTYGSSTLCRSAFLYIRHGLRYQ
jgi:hypothetical protein